MDTFDPSGPDRRQGTPATALRVVAGLGWTLIAAGSLGWLVLVIASVLRGGAGPGLLVVAPIPALVATVAIVGVHNAFAPILRARIGALDRRRAAA